MTAGNRYNRTGKIIFVFLLLLIGFWGYVEIINRNSVHMTSRQKFLKAIYPVWMWMAKLKGTNTKELANTHANPPVSFYTLKDTLTDGTLFEFASLKGKKVMLVNTASDCGYTSQYGDLEKLYQSNKDKLVVIGFPANDFKEQEKGTDTEIAAFCRKNFGVTFPLMHKSSVIKGTFQNEIFRWLTDASKNGWNEQQPTWNFCKYIVDENGKLVHFYGSSIAPGSKDIMNVIQE